jgi:hypothetical protein
MTKSELTKSVMTKPELDDQVKTVEARADQISDDEEFEVDVQSHG